MEPRLKKELIAAGLLLVLTVGVGIAGWWMGKNQGKQDRIRWEIRELWVTNRTLERTIQQIEVTNRIMLGIISNQDAKIGAAGAITNAGSLEDALRIFHGK